MANSYKIFTILVSAIAGVMSCVEGSQFPPADIINNCDLKNCIMQEEIWKDVVGYEGLYQVSDSGRARSVNKYVKCRNGCERQVKGRILVQYVNKHGYATLRLSNKGKVKSRSVHRMKAIAFINNPYNKICINHRDGNKLNNGYNIDGSDNLEWVSHSENNYHAYKELGKKGSCLGRFGSDHYVSRSVMQYTVEGMLVAEYCSLSEASLKIGVSSGNICSCCRGAQKTSGGFVWKYKESGK